MSNAKRELSADDIALLDRLKARALSEKRVQFTWEEAAEFERICSAAGVPFSFGAPPRRFLPQWLAAKNKGGSS
jgi:hypothetical protein